MALSKPNMRSEFLSDVKQAVKELSQGYSDADYKDLLSKVKMLEAERDRLLSQNTKLIAENESLLHKMMPEKIEQIEVPHSEDFMVETLLTENNALRGKLDTLTMQLRNSVVGKNENFKYNGEIYSQVFKTEKSGILFISQDFMEELLCKV